jgi:hypothetical protein
VQAQDPVNTEGEWHVSHAFGDFCEFCHGGNVQATDKGAAHTAMVAPLSDVQFACASCHPNDYGDLAQGYAVALGVTVDVSASAGGGAPSGGAVEAAAPEEAAPALGASAEMPAVQPVGVVDFNQRYDAAQSGGPVNWGNVITAFLLGLMLVGGGAFVVWNERRLRRTAPAQLALAAATPSVAVAASAPAVAARPASRPVTPSPTPSAPAVSDRSASGDVSLRPEIAELLPALQALEPRSLKALKKILNDPAGGDLLATVARIDPLLIEEVRRLDRRERDLLMAFVRDE